MGLSSNHVITEHWTALNVARKQKQRCAEDVESIKKSCEAEHGTKHIVECHECFSKALDRMFGRYKDNTDREWFLGRISVASSLEVIFTEAKERKATFKDIEDNIGSEKEAWYRWVLRRHPEFLAVADSGAYRDEVRSALDDPDRSREELVTMVSQAVGMPDDWSSQVDAFASKVAAAEEDPAALKKLYIEEFFKDRSTGETLPHTQPYLDMYEADKNMDLEDVIDMITSANQEDRSTHAQRETHQKRLDELRRAKTAFEQSRAQAKSKAQGTQGLQANAKYQDIRCAICDGETKPEEVFSCGVCQTFFELGGDMQPTLYCSKECHEQGIEEHEQKEHGCQAEHCVWEDDDYGEMEDESASFMACNECLDKKQATLFCSIRCAEKNLPVHRKGQHGLDTSVDEIRDLVSPLDSFMDMILTDEKTGLKFLSGSS